MELKDLNANPKNPRKISEEKLASLKRSLDTFGDLSGIVFNRRTQRLVGGHQHKKVMPPEAEIVITQEFEPPTARGTVANGYVVWNGEQHKYREVDWDDTTELAANLAANKHGGDWDPALLPEALADLQIAQFDMPLTGFDDMEIDGWMGSPQIPKGEPNDEDSGPGQKECPACGHIW